MWSFPRDAVPEHQQNPFLSSFLWDVWHQLPFFIQLGLVFSNSSPAPPLVFLLQLLHSCRWLYPTVRALSRRSYLAVCRNCKLLFIYLLWKTPLAPICLKCYLYLFSPMKAWRKGGENKLLSLTSSLYLAEKQNCTDLWATRGDGKIRLLKTRVPASHGPQFWARPMEQLLRPL